MPRKSAADLAVIRPQLQPTRLIPPPTLSPAAREVFLSIVLAETATIFRESDLPLLSQYCEAAAMAERAITELQKPDAPVSWLARWEKAAKVMASFSVRLRLCPQARQPNNPKRPETTSYYERMRLERSDEQG
jgi:phage terminase small subunit